jgi:hypothetical protein
MKRGPKPKPYLVKVMEGNRGKRRLDPGIQLPAKPFDPPFQLGAITQREWDRIMSFGYCCARAKARRSQTDVSVSSEYRRRKRRSAGTASLS